MTEAQGWVFLGLLALLAFVYLYRTSTDVVRSRIKRICVIAAVLVSAILFTALVADYWLGYSNLLFFGSVAVYLLVVWALWRSTPIFDFLKK